MWKHTHHCEVQKFDHFKDCINQAAIVLTNSQTRQPVSDPIKVLDGVGTPCNVWSMLMSKYFGLRMYTTD